MNVTYINTFRLQLLYEDDVLVFSYIYYSLSKI
jgi:hypothetical protein